MFSAMKKLVLAAALVLLAPAAPFALQAAEWDEAEIEPAVIFIEVTTQRGDWYTPWQRARPSRASGSGFLIGPGLVLTNAHIVSDAKQIILRRNGDSMPYLATVAHIAHDSDLALLRVADGNFWRGIVPLQLGGLPSLRTHVRTYGFPAGGEKISRTEGVVSRIEFVTYLHSGADAHLAIQTDSAINPGNSGGPVVQDGRVVGVAFQTNTSLNDVGFFIPTPVVKRFLLDVEDGRYEGYGEMGIVASQMINPAHRRYLHMPDAMTGVVVDRILRGTSAEGFLQEGDVLTSLEGQPIRSDGTIDYFGHSLNFEQIAEEKQVGEWLSFSVWREKKLVEVRFPLKEFEDGKRVRAMFDTLPSYVIYSGFVFMVLDQEYLSIFGNYRENAKKTLLYEHFFRRTEVPGAQDRQAVVISRILPHRINSAYRGRRNTIVSTINGVEIRRLADVPQALLSGDGQFLTIEIAKSEIVILLDRQKAARAHEEILATYGIPQDSRLP